ncbi:MAG TPA: tetratricopeptide repeat protein [Streptosporangiaceae bacterium]
MAWPVRSGPVPALADGVNARADTAADLAAALVAGAEVVLVPARVAGEGPGGWLEPCGKTQLAAWIAESLWRSHRLELLVWITATSRASVLSGFVEAAADALGADPTGDSESVAQRFAAWLGETSRPWLVVLDDLRDQADLAGLWPAGQAGRVLITTADPAAFPAEQGRLVHAVGVFRPDEALGQLTSRLGTDAATRQGAEELVQDLGFEPLALAQAGAVMASSGLACREYRDRFLRKRAQLAEAGGSSPAAAVTWEISADHADWLAPGGTAQAVLAIAALLDGHGIPGTVFTTPAAGELLADVGGGSLADQDCARKTVLAAQQAGLLSAEAAGPIALVQMNAVVQAAVRAAVPPETLAQASGAAADALLQVWPADEQPPWLAAALRSCAVSLQRVTGDRLWAGGCHPLLLRAGRSMDRAGLTGPAVGYWQELAGVSDRMLGRGHPDTLAIGEHLAAACLAAGQTAEAVSQYRWVLDERVRVLGPDHPSAIAARRDLGHALVAAGQVGDAITALDRVVSDYERIRGAEQIETLSAWGELAAAYWAAGQYTDAIRLYRQTVDSRERIQGPGHPATLTARRQLADSYFADGRIKTAFSQYKRALADSERALGRDHPGTIGLRSALGSAYDSAGRMASALQLREENRASLDRALGPDHRDTLASCADLAQVYDRVGRVTDATTLLRDTLARCERALPPADPLTEAVRTSLAQRTG